MALPSPSTSRAEEDLAVDLIRDSLRTGSVGVNEARIAYALVLNPSLRSSRSLERASGLSRITVLDTVPGENSDSTLLSTRSRGSSSFKNSRPMQVVFRLGQEALHKRNLSLLDTAFDQERGSAVVPNGSNVRELSKSIQTSFLEGALDPALDLWSNSEQASVGGDRAGGHGWALAMAYGLDPVEVGMDQLALLWGLSARGAREAVSRLVRAGWVSRRRLGRRSVVLVDFSRLPQYLEEGIYVWDDRAARRTDVHGLETVRFTRRHTPLGWRAWMVLRGRAAKLAALPDGVCRIWRKLLATATEEQIYDMLAS